MTKRDLVVIGGSWGGMRALGTILAGLASGLDAALLVVLHRASDGRDALLANALARSTALPIRDAEDKDPLVRGSILLAPADYHLLVERESVALSVDHPVQHSRPSIDVTFESAAEAHGRQVIGILLSGANADGAAGLAEIARRGGLTIVQDPATAERREMPESALRLVKADLVGDPAAIAPALVDACGIGVGTRAAGLARS